MIEIIYDDKFIIIETRFLTQQYSSAFLDDAEWKRLLHLHYMAKFDTGYTTSGQKGFYAINKTSRTQYPRIMSNLEAKKLISTKKVSEKFTSTGVRLAPLYDVDSGNIYPRNRQTKSGSTIRKNKIHYAEVPKNVLDKLLRDPTLSILEIRLMLTLYRYNNLRAFNGVDSNVIHILNGDMFIHPSIFEDLKISKNECIIYLKKLQFNGFINWYTIKVYQEQFDGDERLRIASTKNNDSLSIQIIVPKYQYNQEKRYEKQLYN
jgi:hypothetical protein